MNPSDKAVLQQESPGGSTLLALTEKWRTWRDKAYKDAKATPAKSKARSVLNAIGDTYDFCVIELEASLAGETQEPR